MARAALDPAQRLSEPYEYRVVRANDGQVRWVLAYGEAVFAHVDGRELAVRYVGTLQDITPSKEAEAARALSESRLKLAIDAGRMAVWDFDGATGALRTSPELNRIFGLPPLAHPSVDEFRAFYFPGEQEKVSAEAQKAIREGRPDFEVEFRIRRVDGVVRWLLLRAQLLKNESGAVDSAIGVVIDIDDRAKAEQQREILLRELNHRVKNSLMVVQALAGQSFRSKPQGEALTDFRERLQALARANDLLLSREWKEFDLATLVTMIVAPYAAADRLTMSGPPIMLPGRLNMPLGLVLHELSTNAAKYGAWSQDQGVVSIDWQLSPKGVTFTWQERGGPPVDQPSRTGFGTQLISRILAVELGSVDLTFSQAGATCRIELRF